MKTTFKSSLAVAFVLVSLAGCGGGGGISGFPDGPAAASIPNGPGVIGGPTLRAPKAGDSYTYEITGTLKRDLTDSGGNTTSHNSPITGTCTRTVTDDTLFGSPALRLTETMSYTPQGDLPVVEVRDYFLLVQGDGSVWIVGQKNNERVTQASPGYTAFMPNWSLTASVSGTASFDENIGLFSATQDVTTTQSVQGSEDLTSTSGAYTTWKTASSINESENYDPRGLIINNGNVSDGYVAGITRQTSATDWWAPSISSFVKEQRTVNEHDVLVQSYTYTAGTGGAAGSFTFVYRNQTKVANLTLVLKTRNLAP